MKPFTIIIESVRGSQVKYNYHPEKDQFQLKKLLPVGMTFPYDFGFIPDTRGEDGDPLDAMVIAEFANFPGAAVSCRLIGALQAEQTAPEGTIRNDRYFFIPEDAVAFEHIHTITAFGRKHNEQLSQFFINYNKAEDKQFLPLRYIDAAAAYQELQARLNG
jgi:inorganic pyrophosphatase